MLSTVLAAEPETGISLTIEAKSASTGMALSGVRFFCYRVADFSERGIYSLMETFKASGLEPDTFTTASAMQAGAVKAKAYAEEKKIEKDGFLVTDSDGYAVEEHLERGLYLFCLEDGGDEGMTVEMEPFFLSLPALNMETGVWVYEVKVQPKISTTMKPEEPTEPADPSGPSPSGGGPDSGNSGSSVELPGEQVPLASFPARKAESETPEEIIITDNPAPLAGFPNIPKLGDLGAGGYMAGMLISLSLCGFALFSYGCLSRKKER